MAGLTRGGLAASTLIGQASAFGAPLSSRCWSAATNQRRSAVGFAGAHFNGPRGCAVLRLGGQSVAPGRGSPLLLVRSRAAQFDSQRWVGFAGLDNLVVAFEKFAKSDFAGCGSE